MSEERTGWKKFRDQTINHGWGWVVRKVLDALCEGFWKRLLGFVGALMAAGVLSVLLAWWKQIPPQVVAIIGFGFFAILFFAWDYFLHRRKTQASPFGAPPTPAENDFKLVKAVWGADSMWVDVTAYVQNIISSGTTIIKASTDILGDPIFGRAKTLEITYRLQGKKATASIREGELYNLPTSAGVIRIPPVVTSKASALEIEAVRREDNDRGDKHYRCDIEIHNPSTSEQVDNVLVLLTEFTPVPSEAYSIVPITQRPPLPNKFPIALKPMITGVNTVWPGQKVTFEFFKLVRAGNIPTVEIVGRDSQFCWFKAAIRGWKGGQPYFEKYTFTIEVSSPPNHAPQAQQFKLEWVSDPQGIPSFEIGNNISVSRSANPPPTAEQRPNQNIINAAKGRVRSFIIEFDAEWSARKTTAGSEAPHIKEVLNRNQLALAKLFQEISCVENPKLSELHADCSKLVAQLQVESDTAHSLGFFPNGFWEKGDELIQLLREVDSQLG